MNRLSNKIVLITGASSGIGHACAVEYAKHGSHLILCARRTSRLQELKASITLEYPTIKVHLVTLDVRDRHSVFEVISTLPNDFQAIDILINNAGLVVGLDKVEDVDADAVNIMFDTNVKGLLNMTQAVLPGMKLRSKGHIVNVNSIAGTEAYANGGCYAATKHAVTALTKSLRHELIDTPINITSIEPGMAKADKLYQGMTPLDGQDIAETIAFSTSRPAHVQIASMIIFPTNQSAATSVYRKPQ